MGLSSPLISVFLFNTSFQTSFPTQELTMQTVRRPVPAAQSSSTAAEEALMMQRKLPVELERLPCSGVQFQALHVSACPDMALLMAGARNAQRILINN